MLSQWLQFCQLLWLQIKPISSLFHWVSSVQTILFQKLVVCWNAILQTSVALLFSFRRERPFIVVQFFYYCAVVNINIYCNYRVSWAFIYISEQEKVWHWTEFAEKPLSWKVSIYKQSFTTHLKLLLEMVVLLCPVWWAEPFASLSSWLMVFLLGMMYAYTCVLQNMKLAKILFS